MNSTKLAHLLSIVPLLKEVRNIHGMRSIIEKVDIDTSDIKDYQFAYIRYCLDAFDGERDYNLLRQYLRDTVGMHSAEIKKGLLSLKEVIKDDIHIKYDIGAAHEAYGGILNEVFPVGELYYVDKDRTPYINNAIIGDIFKLNLPDNRETLYFMSEFLHCKKDNIRIIDRFSRSHIIVNEVLDNIVSFRLNMTGGACIPTEDLIKLGFIRPYFYKMNGMCYYMVYRKPI